MTTTPQADVATGRPAPCTRKLCRHFGHPERFDRRDEPAVSWS